MINGQESRKLHNAFSLGKQRKKHCPREEKAFSSRGESILLARVIVSPREENLSRAFDKKISQAWQNFVAPVIISSRAVAEY